MTSNNKLPALTGASRFAVAAATGLLMGGLALSPAQAADLGGDCCADLEERVAELEATTARKGNRKVSLKISGQVNYMLLIWDDEEETDAYITNNVTSTTRFRFTGAAKFKPGWSVGFLQEIEVDSANSSSVSQVSDGRPRENADGSLDVRKAALYIKSDRLGEVWMGRYSPATDDITLLNLGGTPNTDGIFYGNGFFLRAPQGTGGCAGAGCLYTVRIGALRPSGDTRRSEVIRYNTPSLAGFVFSASWGEDDIADVAFRYKKEWNSIRIVGGTGFSWDTDETETGNNIACPDPIGAPQNAAVANACRNFRVDVERWSGSWSVMHTPSGIYGYVAYHHDTFGSPSGRLSVTSGGSAPNLAATTIGEVTGRQSLADTWHYDVHLGLKRRWLAPNLGATTVYGRYAHYEDALVGLSGSPFVGAAAAVAASEIVDSQVTVWGFGLVQDIDKGAFQMWVSFDKFDPDVDVITANAAGAVGPTQSISVTDHWLAQVGAKIKF